tara:strand:- start:231 stop:575 length:345 start_codon:yes stop_codon:yes gene_type:complete
MESVFNIHPDDLQKKYDYLKIIKDNNFNFLDVIKEKYNINVSIYYQIINSTEEFKLKNIFYFMNLRLKKINLSINYENVSYENINEIFNNFINKDIVKSIVIMNLLQGYIHPIF